MIRWLQETAECASACLTDAFLAFCCMASPGGSSLALPGLAKHLTATGIGPKKKG